MAPSSSRPSGWRSRRRYRAGFANARGRSPVVDLDDDVERTRAARDRVALGMLEQPVGDPALLVTGRHEDLVHDYALAIGPEGDVAGDLSVLVRDEDDVPGERVEHTPV